MLLSASSSQSSLSQIHADPRELSKIEWIEIIGGYPRESVCILGEEVFPGPGERMMSAGTQPVPIPWTPAPPQLVMAYSVCKGITRTAAKNFYYAFMVLPRRKREALCAVYAFMRRCDDI